MFVTNHTRLTSTISSKISLWNDCQEKYSLTTTSHEHSSTIQPRSECPHALAGYIHTCTVVGEAILLSAVDILLKHWKLECNCWNFGIWCPQGVVCVSLTLSTVVLTSVWIVLTISFLCHMYAITVSSVIIYLAQVMSNSTRNCVSPYTAFKIFPLIVESNDTNSVSCASEFKVLSFLYFLNLFC